MENTDNPVPESCDQVDSTSFDDIEGLPPKKVQKRHGKDDGNIDDFE